MEEQSIPQVPGPNRRSTLLTVLCILTFVGSGMNLISSVFIAAFYDLFTQIAVEFADKFKLPGLEMLTEATPLFFVVSGLFYAGSIFGAVYMMRLKKMGFHIYTISQILLLIAPMYFMKLPGPGIPEILFSGLFVFLYWRSLNQMT